MPWRKNYSTPCGLTSMTWKLKKELITNAEPSEPEEGTSTLGKQHSTLGLIGKFNENKSRKQKQQQQDGVAQNQPKEPSATMMIAGDSHIETQIIIDVFNESIADSIHSQQQKKDSSTENTPFDL